MGKAVNGPRLLCFGCGKETTGTKPICDACLIAAGEEPRSFCSLCEASLVTSSGVLIAVAGIHRTKAGGYAGKCAAVFTSLEPA
jgi:predicted amidophosphoribosyltransferase